MPKVSKESASRSDDYGAVFERAEDLAGYTVNFVGFREDIDATPLYKGLPDDRCQCPHWGYVIKGRVRFTFGDGREETYEAGDAYYAPPGHTPYLFAGSEVVEFHPTAKLEELMEVVERNMAATEA